MEILIFNRINFSSYVDDALFIFFCQLSMCLNGCGSASVKVTIKEELWKSSELVKLASITVAETVPQWIPLSSSYSVSEGSR